MTSHAKFQGSVSVTGGENADTRGFDYGYKSGVYLYSWTEAGSFTAEAYSHVISGLGQGQRVYFRAKAHNSAGWGYGSENSVLLPTGAVLWAITRPVPREVLQAIVAYLQAKVTVTRHT